MPDERLVDLGAERYQQLVAARALALVEQRQALVDTLEMILHERREFHRAWHAIKETTGRVTLHIYGGEVPLATWEEDDG